MFIRFVYHGLDSYVIRFNPSNHHLEVVDGMSCRALNFGKLLQRPNWPGGMLDHVASTGLEVWQGFSSSDGTSVFCIFTLSRMFVAHACDVLWNYIWICINHRSTFFNKLRRHVSTVLWTWHETTVFLKPSRTLGWSIFAAQVGFCCDQQPGPDDNRCHCHPIIQILRTVCLSCARIDQDLCLTHSTFITVIWYHMPLWLCEAFSNRTTSSRWMPLPSSQFPKVRSMHPRYPILKWFACTAL